MSTLNWIAKMFNSVFHQWKFFNCIIFLLYDQKNSNERIQLVSKYARNISIFLKYPSARNVIGCYVTVLCKLESNLDDWKSVLI